jgi:hypothetical protein
MHRTAAVLLTFATRRSFQWTILAGGLLYVLAIAAMWADPRETPLYRAQTALFIVGFPAGILGFLLVSQAKWQFVDSRARVLPRYASAHLRVLAIAAVIGLFVLPCVAGVAGRLNALGFAACSIVIGASFIWSTHASRLLPMVIGMATFYSLMTQAGIVFWLLPERAAEFQPYHAAIFAGGWLSLAAWLVRLYRLTEEDDDYQIPVNAQSGSATRMERSQASRTLGRQLARSATWSRPADAWHDRLAVLRTRWTGDRRLFRYGFSPVPAYLHAAWLALIMFAVGWFSNQGFNSSPPQRGTAVGAMWPFLFMASLFPGQYLAMRRSRLAQELLLPLSRREFIDGIFLALARTAVMTAMVLGAAAAALAWLANIPLAEGPALVVYLLLALAIQPYFFGMGIWMALFNSAMGRFAGMMLGMIPGLVIGVIGMKLVQQGAFVVAVLVAAATAGVGIGTIAHARRKWLEAELA